MLKINVISIQVFNADINVQRVAATLGTAKVGWGEVQILSKGSEGFVLKARGKFAKIEGEPEAVKAFKQAVCSAILAQELISEGKRLAQEDKRQERISRLESLKKAGKISPKQRAELKALWDAQNVNN